MNVPHEQNSILHSRHNLQNTQPQLPETFKASTRPRDKIQELLAFILEILVNGLES